jgi:REP element-mobilizing transposase RayT
MARQLRLEFPGAIWHVTSRGNEQRDIVCDDLDRRQFVTLLARIVADSGWLLHAWVLMRNHYHLLIETPEIGLSKGVKWLNQTYVQRFNARHDRVGHLFQGRFKSILVEREGHLLELLRYIVLNPVRCGAARFAADYAWSNYGATAALTPSPPWLEVDWTLAQFGEPTRRAAHEGYRRFVADARGASYNPWESLRDQIYLGSPEFREQMQRRVEIKSRSREHPVVQRRIATPPALEILAERVASAFDLPAEDLRTRRNLIPRQTFAFVAREMGWGLTATALWLGITAAGAAKMRDSGRRRYQSDGDYHRRIDAILEKVKT